MLLAVLTKKQRGQQPIS